MSSSSSSGGSDPWAWLGLLKWSLSYTDGTSDTPPTMMSAEDRAFLEKVMKEGLINENDRMKEILQQVTNLMDQWRTTADELQRQKRPSEQQEEQAGGLLQELRDIVEQIDYARAFAAMKGLPFLLGCAGERQVIPQSTRLLCLGIIATMCQNNPPVQKELLELGSIRILSELFFQEDDDAGSDRSNNDPDGKLRAKIIQAISANVRSHELAEAVFCELDQAVVLLDRGLGRPHESSGRTPTALQNRSLFMLHALLTSDSSTRERVRTFQATICWIADHLVEIASEDEPSLVEIREMSLELIQGILEQKKSVNAVLSRKDVLVGTGVKRVAALRRLTGDFFEYARRELELWESVIALLARAEPDTETVATAPPLLEDGSAEGGDLLVAQLECD